MKAASLLPAMATLSRLPGLSVLSAAFMLAWSDLPAAVAKEAGKATVPVAEAEAGPAFRRFALVAGTNEAEPSGSSSATRPATPRPSPTCSPPWAGSAPRTWSS